MVLFVGPESFEQELHTTFKELCADPFQSVRQTMACGFFEVSVLLILTLLTLILIELLIIQNWFFFL